MAVYFITGVAGFLGSHLADKLIAEGHVVRGIDNLVGGSLENVPAEVDFFQGDCNDLEFVSEVSRGSEIFFHAACTAYEGLSVFSPKIITENTYGATISVLTAAIRNGARRFVQCSSMARYGTQHAVPFTEDMQPKPQDPYGIAKFAAELTLKELCETHGIQFVIAVPHNIIGPRQKYDDPFRNVASIMINLMLQNRQPYIYGDGRQQRCFSFIQDVIDPLYKLSLLESVVGETINVGPDEETVTINQLAETIAHLLDFDLQPIYLEGRPREVKYATCSAEKARRLLNYRTTHTLESGLSIMIDSIRRSGVKEFVYHLPIEIDSHMVPKTWRNKLF
jgi:UDP-glucose 4-epimerase